MATDLLGRLQGLASPESLQWKDNSLILLSNNRNSGVNYTDFHVDTGQDKAMGN